MKLCKDCKWAHWFYVNQGGSREIGCVYGLELKTDPVYGGRYYTQLRQRERIDCYEPVYCGPDGKKYVRKWWKFWRPK